MTSRPAHRVFISYTGEDLAAHADAVAAVVQRLEWIAIDHKHWAANNRPSVAECLRYVESCQILVVLVAHRYGWVPSGDEGGSDARSITRIEYEHALKHKLEIVPLLVDDKAVWLPEMMEGLSNADSLKPLNAFKAALRKGLTGFFSTPQSVEALLPIPLQQAGERIQTARAKSVRPREEPSARDDDQGIVPYYADRDVPPTVEERLTMPLPKRILALDGAGVRSGITLGLLERVERLLQIRYGSPEFRLCDYFDLIGGAGPAALIATELARGATVAEVKPIFQQGIKALTSKKFLLAALTGAIYDSHALRQLLIQRFGDRTLGNAELRTGLCITATRFDTGQTLSFTNHPALRSDATSSVPLHDLIVASTALPTYLRPVPAQLGEKQPTLLAAGDLTTGPDPALHLFMLATGRHSVFRWRTGKRRLLMLSLGGGTWRTSSAEDGSHSTLSLIPKVVGMMVEGLRHQSNSLLETLTYELDQNAAPGGADPNAEPVLSYERFDVVLESQWLRDNRLEEFTTYVEQLRRLDNVDAFDTYVRLGQAAGELRIRDPFPSYFDVRKPVATS